MANRNLSDAEMNQVRGGGPLWCCECGCRYANSGGSSIDSNASANYDGGKSSGGVPQKTICTEL